MSTSGIEQPDLTRAARCTDRDLVVALTDGRTVSVPLWRYPRLCKATSEQRVAVEIGRYGLHGEAIDEDIDLAGLLVGAQAPDAVPPVQERV